ncbi:hypothetical protein [Yeosuana marina]|uniref:hypothetical protein n=1 Tax=Yeosuana marina TaxID=1565536 RepID=UPI0030C86526
MSKKLKIGIPCSEANCVCDKAQYDESSFLEKIKLNIHLLYCKACRKYSKTNSKLSSVIKHSKITCMNKKDKECLKKDFEKAIKQNNLEL